MPTYQYKALTRSGQMVKNTVSGISKSELVNKLKANDLTPINIQQAITFMNKDKYRARKHKTVDSVLKNSTISEGESKLQVIKTSLLGPQKITKRDVMVFTQSFLLLKKAQFNNIHALNTVIQSTQNPSMKSVLEDILVGVEARRKYIFYNGIL